MDGLHCIVVNYKTPGDLNHHMQSLEKYAPTVPWHVTIVNVDPGEEDEAVAWHWWTRMSGVCGVTTFRENVGYARAVNRAATSKHYDTLAIFNADTRFRADVLDNCYEALHQNERWGILGPCQMDDNNRITHGGFFGTFGHRSERGFHQPWNPCYTDVRDDAITVSGSAYFVKRSVWDQLTECPQYAWAEAEGAFLPTRHYYEETWCSYHAIVHGWKVVYYGKETMIHKWHQASSTEVAQRHIAPSRELFEEACHRHNIEMT